MRCLLFGDLTLVLKSRKWGDLLRMKRKLIWERTKVGFWRLEIVGKGLNRSSNQKSQETEHL